MYGCYYISIKLFVKKKHLTFENILKRMLRTPIQQLACVVKMHTRGQATYQIPWTI